MCIYIGTRFRLKWEYGTVFLFQNMIQLMALWYTVLLWHFDTQYYSYTHHNAHNIVLYSLSVSMEKWKSFKQSF